MRMIVVDIKVNCLSPDNWTAKPSSASELALWEEHVGIFSNFFGHRLQELLVKMQYSEANSFYLSNDAASNFDFAYYPQLLSFLFVADKAES